MASLTNQKQSGIKIYDMITEKADNKLLAITGKLGIDKFVFESKNRWGLVFYDTPDNLLTKTGILLYRAIENDKHFLKIEKLSFLPSVSRLRKTEIFVVEINAKDTPKTQAFYLINGITEMFSTQFNIDLENVIKAVVPKLEVEISGVSYKGFRGDGFKCLVEFQKAKYKNLVTKRKFKNDECTVTHTSGKRFDEEFLKFLETLERYCKDILPQTSTRYELGMRLTQEISKESKTKLKKEKKKKEKKIRAEDKIEG